MSPSNIQYIFDETGKVSAVIIPISLWENIKLTHSQLSIAEEERKSFQQRVKQRMQQGYPLGITGTFQRKEL